MWGTGSAKRELMHVDDMANAAVYLMGLPQAAYWQCVPKRLSHVNIGTGEDVAIKELVYLVKSIVGFQGEIEFDHSKPDGMPRKLLDVSKLNNMGWKACIGLEEGIRATYQWFLNNLETVRL